MDCQMLVSFCAKNVYIRVGLQREKDYRLFTYSLIHLFTYSHVVQVVELPS